MLGELHIRNFAVIRDISIRFVPGLNVISGDEGTGKSLLVDALSLMMGARAPSGLIRSGSRAAHVETIFWPSEVTIGLIRGILEESGIEPEANGMLLISRDFQDGGRSIARVNNRAVPLSLLRQIGRHLVDIHGQMEYLSLLDSANQLMLVDKYGELEGRRKEVRRTIEELRAKEKILGALEHREKDGYIDLLQYQIDEIDAAALDGIDEESMLRERDIYRRAGAISGGCLDAYATLYGEDRSVSVLMHKVLTCLRGISSADSRLAEFSEGLEGGLAAIEETARELRSYAENVENCQEKLEEIENKIEMLSALKRKYGSSIDAVKAFRDKAVSELLALRNGKETRARLEAERAELKAEAGRKAEELSLARRSAAEKLVRLVNSELADLGLEWARFDIALSRREDAQGLSAAGGKAYAYTGDGIDRLEFQVATNPGEPIRPMSAIASGGETSRIVLAVKSALKIADPIPTLVFDEIDMGVGGRNADSVGRKLGSLAGFHQVLCITHLPQIACFGDIHFKLNKVIEGGRASSTVETIEGQDRIRELAVMLGSERNGGVMMKGAEALIKNAEKWKSGARELVVA
ncbi:MAG: DNA repair protein RecN [Dehalococcoidia bacterium]|jgi:DNA repair protein RecN (Recombination protein N)